MSFVPKRSLLIILVAVAFLFISIPTGCQKEAKPEPGFKLVKLSQPESVARVNSYKPTKGRIGGKKMLVLEQSATIQINEGSQNILHVINSANGKDVATKVLGSSNYSSVTGDQVSLNGEFVLVKSTNNGAEIWLFSADLFKRKRLLKLKPGWIISSITWSPNGRQLAFMTYNNNYKIIKKRKDPFDRRISVVKYELIVNDLSTGRATSVFQWKGRLGFSDIVEAIGPPGPNNSIAWGKDGILLSQNKKIRLIVNKRNWEQRTFKINYLSVAPFTLENKTKTVYAHSRQYPDPEFFEEIFFPSGRHRQIFITSAIDLNRMAWFKSNYLVILRNAPSPVNHLANYEVMVFKDGREFGRFGVPGDLNYLDPLNGVCALRLANVVITKFSRFKNRKGVFTIQALSPKNETLMWSRKFSSNPVVLGEL